MENIVDRSTLKERERWSSRAAFYFATIGAAVGFGNIWRFPSLVYEYGGGAFFIPYVLALLFIGLPILVLEISLGQYYETGDVDVFGGIHARLRGVGLSSIACGYMVVTYYSMLLSWVTHAFFDSFGKENFWANEEVTGTDAHSYFQDHIIGMNTLGPDLKPTRLVWKNAGYSLLTWTVVYLCIAFGIKWTGRITYFTMGVPIILLFIMLVRSITLAGSQEGIQQYLSSDWSVLVNQPEVWTKAVAQIFFSLGITFGIMTAYGSHCHREEPAFMNSCVIAASNSLYSFIAGFVVFATLGHLAFLEDKDIQDLEFSGFGLLFGSWPVVLGTLPGGEHWIRLLFVMLFCLGIDSAFCFMEGFLICMNDTVFFGVDRKYTALGLSVVAWLFSLLYATDAGYIFLDTIDYYVNFVMLLVGGTECFAAGWIYNIEEQVDNLGASIVFTYMATTFGSVFLSCILWFAIDDKNTAVWVGFIGFVAFYLIGMVFVCYLMRQRMEQFPEVWNWNSMLYDLMVRNMMDLRDDLCGVVGYIPTVWAFLIKYFIPPIIIVLFSVGCAANTFGHYGGYPFRPFQLLGILSVVFVGFLVFSSLVMPAIYASFQKPDSPVPNRDATIHAAPEEISKDNCAVTLHLNSAPETRVWPPRSFNAPTL